MENDKNYQHEVFDKDTNRKVIFEKHVPPKVTPKNFNHLVKASLGLAETSNLH